MKIFDTLSLLYSSFTNSVNTYLIKTLSSIGTKAGPNTIFGQMINVFGSAIQNVMLYIEDALTEQNKLTATRKKSIYNLAAISGYVPSMGKAAGCNVKISFLPSASHALKFVLKNRTKILCETNGMTYNIILPQEAMILNYNTAKSKVLYAVEGKFETQTYIANGGKTYTQPVNSTNDIDLNYLEVKINDETWERVESMYDMSPEGKQYMVKPSVNKGFILTFGNTMRGKAIELEDRITVTYLVHSGEIGNIPSQDVSFIFEDDIEDISGETYNANKFFLVQLENENGITSGTNSETSEDVRAMIGYNSRALVLADANNYKLFINRFSFTGYNRTWSEPGSLIVSSLIMKNYANQLASGKDYFSLQDEDFKLSQHQKDTIVQAIDDSQQQLAGAIYQIFDPEIKHYAIYVYLKMKENVDYDEENIRLKVENLIGEFFANLQSDKYIPKSDIAILLRTNIDQIDSVDVYFISEDNEKAMIDNHYTKHIYAYNPVTGSYIIKDVEVDVPNGTDPGLGLDEHGNIYLDSNTEFPACNKQIQMVTSDESIYNGGTQKVWIDPLTIIFR